MRRFFWGGFFVCLGMVGVWMAGPKDLSLSVPGLQISNQDSVEAMRESDSSSPISGVAESSSVVSIVRASDLRKITIGDSFSLQGVKSSQKENELFEVLVTEHEEREGVVRIKGELNGGGKLIATLTQSLTQIFVSTSKGAWRYMGSEFSGEVIPSKSVGLENDVRRPVFHEALEGLQRQVPRQVFRR
ncbi:MAG: hypothetical protein VW879_16200 [Opitutae bacterium]